MKSKRTKALEISPEVKKAVYERDNGWCVVCGQPGNPEAHYIARSHGGLGIEENIVTLCRDCHREFDQGLNRRHYKKIIENYLRTRYADWDESKLTYKKQ